MPRYEQPIDGDDPIARFAMDLRRLRQKAGNPPYRQLARDALFSASALADAASGRKLPSLAVTLAYVRACGGDAVEWEVRRRELVTELACAETGPHSDDTDDAESPCPYVGLAAFQPEDADRFFGREQLIEELVARLAVQSFLAAFGASGALYRGVRLAQARDWATTLRTRLTTTERAFLDASSTAEAGEQAITRRSARRLRYLATVLAVLLIVTTTSTIVAIRAQRAITHQRDANLAQIVADQALALYPTDPNLSVQLGLVAYRLTPGRHTRDSLLSMLPRAVVSHDNEILSAAFAPDGRTLLTGSGDHTARLQDLSDQQHPIVLATLQRHTGAVNAVAISPDGRIAATASRDRTIQLWDISDPRHPTALTTLLGHTDTIYGVAFSHDGQTLATGSGDYTARLWDIRDPRHPAELTILRGHRDVVNELAFSPRGRTLATTGDDKTVRLWNVENPSRAEELASLTGHTDNTYAVAFSPDGTTLATASDDRTARLWNVTDPRRPEQLATLTGHTDGVYGVAFSPDGTAVATSSDDHTVRLWNIADLHHPTEQLTLTGHADAVESLMFSPDGSTLATSSWDETTRLLDTNFEQTITDACVRVEHPITRTEWNHYLPGLTYRPPCRLRRGK